MQKRQPGDGYGVARGILPSHRRARPTPLRLLPDYGGKLRPAEHVDHIIPETAGGTSTAENLCLACFSCNVHKAAQQSGADPTTGETVPLFHPLRQRLSEHFAWDESNTQIIGLTPCGRATVTALRMNNPAVVRAR